MEQQTYRGLDWPQLGMIAVGVLLFGAGMVVLAFEPGWTVSPAGAGAALIAAGLTLVITTLARQRRERQDDVVVDERVVTIGEKSGYRAYQASFIVQGAVFAVVELTRIDLPLDLVLGALFAFTGLVYVIAYNWYRRSM